MQHLLALLLCCLSKIGNIRTLVAVSQTHGNNLAHMMRLTPSSTSEPLRPPSTSESANSTTLPVNNSAFLSISSQLRCLRALSLNCSLKGGTVAADSIHGGTGSITKTPEAPTDPNAQQPESLACAMSSLISPANRASGEFSGTIALAGSTHAELEARNSSELADPRNLQEGHHSQSETSLVSEPLDRSEHAAVVSEPVSNSADGLMVSEPASGSADAVTLSEPVSSRPGIMSFKSGPQTSHHAPPVTSLADSAKPTVSDLPSQELPPLRLSQQAVSAEDSLATSQAGARINVVSEPSTVGSDSPNLEQAEVAFGTDANAGPSTSGSDSPNLEQAEIAYGTDAIPRPSTAGSDSPHSKHPEAVCGSDAVPGPSTAGSRSPHTQQQSTAFDTAAFVGPSTVKSDSSHTEQLEPAVGIDAVPGSCSLHPDSPQVDRQSSSATASTSGSDAAAPEMSTHAQRLKAQKGTAVDATSLPNWFVLWAA